MSTKIRSPFPFTGKTTVGVVSLEFTDGEAEFDGTLSNDARRRLHTQGFTVAGQSDPGFGEPQEHIDESPLTAVDGSGAPAKSDTKAAWVDYGVSQGHQRESLEDLTKAEIQSLFED